MILAFVAVITSPNFSINFVNLAVHEEEISQLMKDLEDKDNELDEKLKELEEKHAAEIAEYQEKMEQLQQGKSILLLAMIGLDRG